VRRRFKDVVALSRLLPALLPGAILPARPERNFVEGRLRMSPAFVEQRCAGGAAAVAGRKRSHMWRASPFRPHARCAHLTPPHPHPPNPDPDPPRRAAMERYLNRLAAHAEVARSEVWRRAAAAPLPPVVH
jgi:hypothetical protein